mmetsp:Transcript_5540/g.14381  ORF Transcript_5540/g.14381 Transcript_5540/m.14381 type:complete len:250 (+) Transcript_5540:704-1453(+)
MLLLEDILVLLPELHNVGHVDFVEGGEHGKGVLGTFQALRNALSHPGHRNTPLSRLASICPWSGRGSGGRGSGSRGSGGLLLRCWLLCRLLRRRFGAWSSLLRFLCRFFLLGLLSLWSHFAQGDRGHGLSHLDGVVHRHKNLPNHASSWGSDVNCNLVCFNLENDLILGNSIAWLLFYRRNGTLRYGVSHLRHFDGNSIGESRSSRPEVPFRSDLLRLVDGMATARACKSPQRTQGPGSRLHLQGRDLA